MSSSLVQKKIQAKRAQKDTLWDPWYWLTLFVVVAGIVLIRLQKTRAPISPLEGFAKGSCAAFDSYDLEGKKIESTASPLLQAGDDLLLAEYHTHTGMSLGCAYEMARQLKPGEKMALYLEGRDYRPGFRLEDSQSAFIQESLLEDPKDNYGLSEKAICDLESIDCFGWDDAKSVATLLNTPKDSMDSHRAILDTVSARNDKLVDVLLTDESERYAFRVFIVGRAHVMATDPTDKSLVAKTVPSKLFQKVAMTPAFAKKMEKIQLWSMPEHAHLVEELGFPTTARYGGAGLGLRKAVEENRVCRSKGKREKIRRFCSIESA